MQDTVGAGDWEQFKKQLYKLYLGSTGERKYAIADLKALVEKWGADPMETSEEFGIYHCSFLPITLFLRNKSQLSEREISLHFLQGLGHTLKSKVQGQLWIEKPKNLADNPWKKSLLQS